MTLGITFQFRQLGLIRDVALRGNQHHWLTFESGAKTAQLTHNYFKVFRRIRPPTGIRNIHQMDQQPGALDVPEELHAQAAAQMREISVDLPALGYPTRPTSASSFSSSRSVRSSPGRPSSCSRGAWWVDVLNCALPRPPRPPRAITRRSSGWEKSCTFSPESASYTMVPTGTLSRTSSPSRPVLFDPSPCRPRWALYSGLKRK